MSMELGAKPSGETLKPESQPTNLETAKINPDKLIEPSGSETGVDIENAGFNPDRLAEPKTNDIASKNEDQSELSHDSDVKEFKLYSSLEDRLRWTPLEGFIGRRGDSKCVPTDKEIAKRLTEYGIDSIEYRNGVVDFSPISLLNVEIDMTPNRYSNFKEADAKAAEEWNKTAFKGSTEWTAEGVKDWRTKHKYTWHEHSDQKTCQLVPHDIHSAFRHTGGVFECALREKVNNGGVFDD